MKSTPEKMEQHIEMIKREIYLLIELKHPRVISIQSNFYVYGDNHIHIVMEYARNGSLLNLLHKRHGRLLNGAVSLKCKDKFSEKKIQENWILLCELH